MKRSGYRSVLPIYVIFFILVIGMALTGFGMFLYNITIQKPDGQIAITRWPIDFTKDFSAHIAVANAAPYVDPSGQQLLRDNQLWLQILDANGDEVQSVDKPRDVPTHYSPADLLRVYTNGSGDYSLFFGSARSGEKEWTYLIGFPVPVARITTYVNKDRYDTVKPIVYGIAGVALLLLFISTFVYSLLVTKQMDRIRKSIREIAARTFQPARDSGSFSELYGELNTLDREIKSSDEARAKTERLREEWIANITHDLKTPLAPIRGYAELIADPGGEMEPDRTQKYGSIILKNAAYAEELIDDLKLTFQLKNEMLALNKSRQNLVRFTKELVIDLLNTPEFLQRNISFHSTREDVEFSFDAVFLKRAFNNLLTNALIHNSPETTVSVSIAADEKITVRIQDNGCGLDAEELDQLFVRYYRGKNTEAKPEGSGLGMAIARQIVEQHGGRILAESSPGSGTCITIEFPG